MTILVAHITHRQLEDEQEKFDTPQWNERAADAYRESFLAGVPAFKKTDDIEEAETLAAIRIRKAVRENFKALYEDFYLEVIIHFAQFTAAELKELEESRGFTEGRNLSAWRKAARDFIKRYAGKAITGIANSTIRAFKRIVQVGTDEGEGTEKLASRLAKEAVEFSKSRATTWVKTELVAASNYGTWVGAMESPLDMWKFWITSIDGRERDSHREANGSRADKAEPFIVGGKELMYPGDPNAPLKERIRCRCTHYYEVKE